MPVYSRAPVRSKSNPNLPIVILAVVFAVTSIGLFLWGWAGLADQRNSENLAKGKAKEVESITLDRDFYELVAAEQRVIMGQKLSEDEKAKWIISRRKFFKGEFDKIDEKVRKTYSDLVDDALRVASFDDESGKYIPLDVPAKDDPDAPKRESPFQARLDDKDNQIRGLKAECNDKDQKIAAANKIVNNIHNKYDQDIRKLDKLIREGSAAALREAGQQSEAMKESFKRNSELLNELMKEKEAGDQREFGYFAKLLEKENQIRALTAKLAEKEKDLAMMVAPNPGGAPAGVVQKQLFLDVSMGRPLSDIPVGTIAAVGGDKVLIEVYPDDRVDERLKLRTKLTFNVFSGGRGDGRFDRTLKATIEVISVKEGRFAEARITARFGGDRNPVEEGDQLYNSAWGTHVVVAGQVNLFGRTRGESQAEQARNLKSYLVKLEDQGAIVDAYVDLVDGSIKGPYPGITSKTRFLILGWELSEGKGIAAALAEAPDGANKAKIEDEARERIKAINKQREALKTEAKDRGLFIISPENFAAVAGYRKIGGYGPDEIPFEPRLPAVLPAN